MAQRLTVALMVVFAACSMAAAGVIATEQFLTDPPTTGGYTASTNIAGQSGGEGFGTNTWTTTKESTYDQYGIEGVESPGLTHNLLADEAGGALNVSRTYTGGSATNFSESHAITGATTETTYYQRGLFRLTGTYAGNYEMNVGYEVGDINGYDWGLRYQTATGAFKVCRDVTAVPLEQDTTYLLITCIQINASGSDDYRYALLIKDGDSLPDGVDLNDVTTWTYQDLTGSVGAGGAPAALSMSETGLGAGNNATFYHDEWVLGTSVEDLGIVPEPGTMALLTCGAVGVIARRRGRAA